MDLQHFLARLYQHCEDNQVETRALPSKHQAFHALGDWPAIETWCKKNKGQNLYFAVGTRNGGGTKEHIRQIPAVWCDIDFKETPKEEAERRLREFPLRPSLVVNSGGGYHAYWMLKEPLGREDIVRVEAVLRQIQTYLGGDPAATDASRNLRLPGTFNHKYQPARLVTVHTSNDFAYLLEDIAEDLPAAPHRSCEPSRVDIERKTSEEIERIMQCSFLQHCDRDRTTLPEIEWYCMVSNLARVQGGPAKVHELSRGYPGYNLDETKEKILHSLNDTGPHTCEYIKGLWDCEKDCGVKAPAALARKSTLTEQEPWPDPLELPSILPPVPVMPEEFLPETLRAYAKDVADRMQIPLEFVAVPLVVALGFLVARKVAILPKRHDNWLVVPNLWGADVGRPGVLKSPAQEKAIDPVELLEIRARTQFKEARQFREAGTELLELKVKDIKSRMKEAIKNKQDSLLRDLQNNLADLNTEKERATSEVAPTYIVTDITVEKLQEHMATNPGGLLLARDELSGLLATFEKAGREGDREFYLEAWSGTKSYKCDRIGRGSIYIERNRLSIIGSIQPGKLQKHVQRALDGETGDDGLLQRFQLIVWPEVSPEWKQVDRWENLTAREAAFQVFRNIDALNPSSIGAEQGRYDIMPSLRFSRDGQEIFDEWFCELEHRLRSKELKETPVFESHLAKYRSLMPSLALVFHVVDVVSGRAEGPVSREAAIRAVEWSQYLEAHARKVYAEEMQGETMAAHALAEKILSGAVGDGDSVRGIWRNGWMNLGSPAKVLIALGILERCHWVRQEQSKPEGRGRPSQVVRISPKVSQIRDNVTNNFGVFGVS